MGGSYFFIFVFEGLNPCMIMRRILILFALICLLPLQSVVAQKKPEVKLGLKFAPNLSFMTTSTQGYSSNGVKFGGVVGLVSDFYFAEHYAFSTGFNFSFLGGKITYADKVMQDTSLVSGIINNNLSFVYIEIPLMIKMFTKKFGKFSFFGQIGFGTGFRIVAHSNQEFIGSKGFSTNEQYDYKGETTLIRESVIVGLGTEFYLDQSTRLFLGFGYSNSLNNILKGFNFATGLNQKGYLNYAELNLGLMF